MPVCTICKTDKSPELFREDTRKRNGLSSWCMDCTRLKDRERYTKEKEKRCSAFKERYYNDKDKYKAQYKKWADKNRAAKAAINAQRHAAKMRRTPKWLSSSDLMWIKEIYRTCAEVSEVTGTPHHVDHIVPLQGTNVSGLHVPWNLQIISASENASKRNHLLPELIPN